MDCYQFIKENFSQLNGKLYRTKSNKNYLILALMRFDEKNKNLWKELKVKQSVIDKVKEDNDAVLKNIQGHFYVSEPFALNDELQIENQPNVGTLDPLPMQYKKNGVLMVMIENFDDKFKNFHYTGKLVIGIKYTKDSMAIVEHLSTIGFVLFHHRNKIGQHLFAVKGECKVVSAKDVEPDRYKNVKTTELYVAVDIDTSIELDASKLDSSKIKWKKETRYDAQFARLEEIKVS